MSPQSAHTAIGRQGTSGTRSLRSWLEGFSTDRAEEKRLAIETFGAVFAGSTRSIVVTGGVLLTPPGETFKEDARPPVAPLSPRVGADGLRARRSGRQRLRGPQSALVHGQGERHGFVPMLVAVARETGVSAYVGDGQNLWPAVHRTDAARVYRLALERGAQGEAYHAVAEEGVAFRQVAEASGNSSACRRRR